MMQQVATTTIDGKVYVILVRRGKDCEYVKLAKSQKNPGALQNRDDLGKEHPPELLQKFLAGETIAL